MAITKIILLGILIAAGGFAVIYACSADATDPDCHLSCICTSPSGGAGYCDEGPNYVYCYAEDKDGNQTCETELSCSSGGGGGGSISGCDVSGGAWWLDRDPFAI